MLYLLLSKLALAVPTNLTQQGRLLDSNGVPVEGTHVLTVQLFDGPISNNSLWGENINALFTNGYYSILLGTDTSNPLDTALLEQDPLYLEIQIDTEPPMVPRNKLTSLPYAKRSDVATSVEGGTVNASQISINGTVVVDGDGAFVGQPTTPQWSDIQNIPSDFADGVDNDSQLSSSEVINYIQQDAIDLNENTTINGEPIQRGTDADSLADISCVDEGMILTVVNGVWDCGYDDVLDANDVIGYVEDTVIHLKATSTVDGIAIATTDDLVWDGIGDRPDGLDDGDDDTLGNLNCSTGEIPVYDVLSSNWICGQDIDTTLSAQEVQSMIESAPSISINLSASSNVDGADILTSNTQLNVDWNNINNKPTGVDDGDTLDTLNCNDGEIAMKQNGTWTCTVFSSLVDADGDGSLQWNDCNDNDNTLGDVASDVDCDGVLTDADCDDSDGDSTYKDIDADCDGIVTDEDCNDNDTSFLEQSNDQDCDGVVTADDCNDNDVSLLEQSNDQDCDGYLSGEDCDDSNANAFLDNGKSSSCSATTCQSILNDGLSSGDGTYWVSITGSPMEVYCDMTTDGGGWNLVSVSMYANRGQSGWNSNSDFNSSNFTNLNAHWHYSATKVNALANSNEFRANCFDSNNNYTRYWYGASNYNWGGLTSASSSWSGYNQTGTSYSTSWAGHHYGLVSGNNETVVVITAHSGNQWACGGNSAPGGEGYTGRNGISNIRLWAR